MADTRTVTRHDRADAAPLAALFLGALAMGISPIFVRLAEVGPFASAFWRVAGALPLLYLWAAYEARSEGEAQSAVLRLDGAILTAGLLFGGDLIFWHLAILHTSVANATFLATLAPVWVALGSGLLIGETVGRETVGGLLLCLGGAAALIGTSATLRPDHLDGDLFGLATSFFFGMYFLAVRSARRRSGPGRIVFLSSAISAAALFAVALFAGDRIFPPGLAGWAALAGLAVVSHTGGQGLLTYALGHLPAAFSALVIFIEAVAAAAFAWLFLDEPVTLVQAVGGVLIIAGIAAARPGRKPAPAGP
ncbi:MAG TPA: DMT family transporter [Bauldia sp.]|nr:DMT family transporter [Bauldia sp.]